MSRFLFQEFRTPVLRDDGTFTTPLQKNLSSAVVLSATGPNSIADLRQALPIYANNAAALAGKLVAGQLYRTGADPDLVAVVH